MESSKSISNIFKTNLDNISKTNDMDGCKKEPLQSTKLDNKYLSPNDDKKLEVNDDVEELSRHFSPTLIPFFNKIYKNSNWNIHGALPLQELKAISQLRSDQDKLSILTVFSKVSSNLSFSSDILDMLMHLVPYPIPVRGALVLPKPYEACENFFSDDCSVFSEQYNTFSDRSSKFQYDGFIHDYFNVNIPWTLKKYEINTNWREVSDFNPSIPFRQMLDQLSIGSYNLLRESDCKSKNEEKPFPPLFLSCIDTIPLRKLAELSNNYPQDIALEILRDWGIILRDALSNLPSEILGDLLACGGCKMIINRLILKNVYEKATLRWLTKRYGWERLV
jgi:hypothetical protein